MFVFIYFIVRFKRYSSASLVRASVVRGTSVVRGFKRQIFSSHPQKLPQNKAIFLLNFAFIRPQNALNSFN